MFIHSTKKEKKTTTKKTKKKKEMEREKKKKKKEGGGGNVLRSRWHFSHLRRYYMNTCRAPHLDKFMSPTVSSCSAVPLLLSGQQRILSATAVQLSAVVPASVIPKMTDESGTVFSIAAAPVSTKVVYSTVSAVCTELRSCVN